MKNIKDNKIIANLSKYMQFIEIKIELKRIHRWLERLVTVIKKIRTKKSFSSYVMGSLLVVSMGLAWTVQSMYASNVASSKETEMFTVSGQSIRQEDQFLMARVIEGEAADEPFIGKVAVGAVIVNRLENDQFPDTIKGVVNQPLAFEAVSNGQYLRPLSNDSLEAARAALKGQDPTSGSLYYWNPETAKSKWVWQRPVTQQIGRHVFAN